MSASRLAATDRSGPAHASDMSTVASTDAVHADDTIVEAARTMARNKVERLPVLDEEDRLVGIVTRRDLLKVFLRPDSEIRAEGFRTLNEGDKVQFEVVDSPKGPRAANVTPRR